LLSNSTCVPLHHGVCALFFGVAAGMYRRRQRRLQALALEREYLLEAAEAELATGRPMRRETLYALAGRVGTFIVILQSKYKLITATTV
jgi:hypothetical protein